MLVHFNDGVRKYPKTLRVYYEISCSVFCWISLSSKNFNKPSPPKHSAYTIIVHFSLIRLSFFLSCTVSENKTLCHPASVDSLSTSAGTEDHVSMGGFAARKALQVVRNVEKVGTTTNFWPILSILDFAGITFFSCKNPATILFIDDTRILVWFFKVRIFVIIIRVSVIQPVH